MWGKCAKRCLRRSQKTRKCSTAPSARRRVARVHGKDTHTDRQTTCPCGIRMSRFQIQDRCRSGHVLSRHPCDESHCLLLRSFGPLCGCLCGTAAEWSCGDVTRRAFPETTAFLGSCRIGRGWLDSSHTTCYSHSTRNQLFSRYVEWEVF